MKKTQFVEFIKSAIEDFSRLEIVTGVGSVKYQELSQTQKISEINKKATLFEADLKAREEYQNANQETQKKMDTEIQESVAGYKNWMEKRASLYARTTLNINFAAVTRIDVIDGDISTFLDTQLAAGTQYKEIREIHKEHESKGFEIVESRIQALGKLVELVSDKF